MPQFSLLIQLLALSFLPFLVNVMALLHPPSCTVHLWLQFHMQIVWFKYPDSPSIKSPLSKLDPLPQSHASRFLGVFDVALIPATAPIFPNLSQLLMLPFAEEDRAGRAHVPLSHTDPSQAQRRPPLALPKLCPALPNQDTECQHLAGVIKSHHLALKPLFLTSPARHLAAHTEVLARGRHLVSGPGRSGGTLRAPAAPPQPSLRWQKEWREERERRNRSRRAKPGPMRSSLLLSHLAPSA